MRVHLITEPPLTSKDHAAPEVPRDATPTITISSQTTYYASLRENRPRRQKKSVRTKRRWGKEQQINPLPSAFGRLRWKTGHCCRHPGRTPVTLPQESSRKAKP